MKKKFMFQDKFLITGLCFMAFVSTLMAMEPRSECSRKRPQVAEKLEWSPAEKKTKLACTGEVPWTEVPVATQCGASCVRQLSFVFAKFKPDDPKEHDNSQQFGLKLLDSGSGQEIGHIVYEVFFDEDDDVESDDEIDESYSKTGSIGFLFIEKAYRKNCFGRILLDRACRHLQKLGCDSVVLDAAPEEKSMLEKLIGFYEKAGFSVAEGQGLSDVSDDDPNPAVSMCKIFRR